MTYINRVFWGVLNAWYTQCNARSQFREVSPIVFFFMRDKFRVIIALMFQQGDKNVFGYIRSISRLFCPFVWICHLILYRRLTVRQDWKKKRQLSIYRKKHSNKFQHHSTRSSLRFLWLFNTGLIYVRRRRIVLEHTIFFGRFSNDVILINRNWIYDMSAIFSR